MPGRKFVCEEAGDEVVLMKNAARQVIGFEKLNFSVGPPLRVAFEATAA